MNLKSKFFSNLATKLLKQDDKAKALKELAQKKDWKIAARKCHDKISTAYKFWITKKDSAERNARIADMTRDIAFMNTIEGKDKIDDLKYARLQQLCKKYSVD